LIVEKNNPLILAQRQKTKATTRLEETLMTWSSNPDRDEFRG
jgi:hypothetical protein